MSTVATTSPLHAKLTQLGYFELREIPGKGLCGILPFAFTIAIVYGLDEYGYKGRYCYSPDDIGSLIAALHTWTGEGHPDGPWIKHKGYGVDEYNPNRKAS